MNLLLLYGIIGILLIITGFVLYKKGFKKTFKAIGALFGITTLLFSGVIIDQFDVSSQTAFILDGNSSYINDTNVYIRATPHQMYGSGWLYINFTSKNYTGGVYFGTGYNGSYWNLLAPQWYNNNTQVVNGSNVTIGWTSLPTTFTKITKNYDGKDTWFVSESLNVNEDQEYGLRVWVEVPYIPPGSTKNETFPDWVSKYDLFFMPDIYPKNISGLQSAIDAGHFYILDPLSDPADAFTLQLDLDNNLDNETGAWSMDTAEATNSYDSSNKIEGTHSRQYADGRDTTEDNDANAMTDFGDGNFTISVWVNGTDSSDSTVSAFISNNNGWTANGQWFIYIDDTTGEPTMVKKDSGGTNYNVACTGSGDLNDNDWHHIVFIRNSTSSSNGLSCYIDGLLVISGDGRATLTLDELWLGGIPTNSPPDYEGLLDEVILIKGYAWTDVDVSTYYNDTLGLSNSAPIVNQTSIYLHNNGSLIIYANATDADGENITQWFYEVFVDGSTNQTGTVTGQWYEGIEANIVNISMNDTAGYIVAVRASDDAPTNSSWLNTSSVKYYTGWTLLTEEDFTGASTNMSGGTHDTTNDWYDGPDSGTWSLYYSHAGWPIVRVETRMYYDTVNNQKVYPNTRPSNTDDMHVLVDNSGGNTQFKNEPGYEHTSTEPGLTGWYTFNTIFDKDNDLLNWSNGDDSWSNLSAASVADYNTTRIAVGTSNTEHRMDFIRIWVLGNASVSTVIITNDDVESGITDDDATITWTTDVGANTSVNYGTDTDLGTVSSTDDSVTSHVQILDGLAYGTLYYYNVTSCESGGVCNTTGPHTFTTFGQINITHNTPASGNQTQNAFFTWNDTIVCDGGPAGSQCGNVSAYLDPTFTPLIDPDADGPFDSGGTNEVDYYSLVNDGLFQAFAVGENASWTNISCPDGQCLWIPKYDSSTDFQTMNGCNGKIKGTYDMANNFMVTDEFSQVAQLTSMSNNGTKMVWVVNTINWINASDDSHGALTEWCVSIDNNVINKTATTDTASDADARLIDALFTCAGNTNFNSTVQQSCYDLADQMAKDFVSYNVLTGVDQTSAIDGSTLVYWPCGGSNVCTAVTNSGFMYTGYYGDNAVAMLKACKSTGNTTYCAIADDFALIAIQAAGNSTVGYWTAPGTFRAPDGVHHKWDAATPRRAVCTNTCGSTWDYSDAPRFTSLGTLLYQANRTSTTINSNLTNYLTDMATATEDDGDQCLTATTYNLQFLVNGSCKIDNANSGWYETGVGSQLALWTNQTLVETFLDSALGSGHYNPATIKWDTTGEFGVYRQTFPIRTFGIALDLDVNAYSLYGTKTGLISTTVADTPFYTTDNNPQNSSTCLATNLTDTDTCIVTWSVNATGDTGVEHTFYSYYSSNVSTQQNSANILINISVGADPTISLCSGISSIVFIGKTTPIDGTGEGFNWTDYTLTDYNISAQNQGVCLFNITGFQTTQRTFTGTTNDTTTSKQRVYCGTSAATRVELNTTPVTVVSNVVNTTLSCWMDWIAVDSASFKDFNITIQAT